MLMLGITSAIGQSGPEKPKDKGPLPFQIPVNIPLEGRFRVTLTGFTVNRQTSDNILEADGKGDEIYVLAETAQYDAHADTRPRDRVSANPAASMALTTGLRGRGNLTLRRSLASVLMGDINFQNDPPRIRAGSASSVGGLRTGDRYPTNEPWNLSGAPRADRLPMLLWEGDLHLGRELVIICPTIWEWDGGNVELRSTFAQDVNRYFSGSTYRDEGFVWRGFVGGDAFGAGDRPIGMVGGNAWVPSALFLNFQTARDASTSSPSNIGIGVVEIRYAHGGEDYSLYFKIESLR
jgi:hypothetical protein